MPVKREFEDLTVDGRNVRLRIFLPDCPNPRPAVLMVCGLFFLGGGLMGRIGLFYNDNFGFFFARAGVVCVQVHTPCRHMAHTRMLELICLVVWPLMMIYYLSYAVLVMDVLLLAVTPIDLCFLLLVPLLPNYMHMMSVLPVIHLAMRSGQWLQGILPWPKNPSTNAEIAAASEWMRKNTDRLCSDGRIVLCGYSSGGHGASLHAFDAASPRYESVILVSGLYDLRTSWTDYRRFFAPVFNMLYQDCYGASDADARLKASPEAVVPKKVEGDWYVLSARCELMGLQPLQDMIFKSEPLCTALAAAGAKVNRVQCGMNHWTLILAINGFIEPFCRNLIEQSSSGSTGK
mmetsp:Transcript_111859/g.176665  ORF Transcript_111859/g.176665 Transcript_111859/m.176665 type:complete len:347 (-) Transcript_111859:27-1067(-)